MRVLMVQTPSVEGISSERVYPIGIVLLAGCLKGAGHDVEIIDMNLQADPFGALKNASWRIPSARCLPFTPEYRPPWEQEHFPRPALCRAELRRLCSSISPGTTIIAGGTGFSLFPERLMREVPEIRYGFIGEAERGLPRLLESLDSPPRLKGLCFQKKGASSLTPPDQDFDMSAYVPPQDLSRPFPLSWQQCLRPCHGHRDQARVSFRMLLLRLSEASGKTADIEAARGGRG